MQYIKQHQNDQILIANMLAAHKRGAEQLNTLKKHCHLCNKSCNMEEHDRFVQELSKNKKRRDNVLTDLRAQQTRIEDYVPVPAEELLESA